MKYLISKREFISIYLSSFLLIIAVDNTIPAISYIVFITTHTQKLTTLVISIWGFSYAIASPIVGFIYYLMRGKGVNILVISMLLMIASTPLLFIHNPISLLIFRFILGILEAFIFVGFMTILIIIHPTYEVATQAIGYYYSLISLTLIIAPTLSSIAIKYANPLLTFYIYLILMIIATLIVYLYRDFLSQYSIENSARSIAFNFKPTYLIPILTLILVGALDGSIQSRSVLWLYQVNLDPSDLGYLITTYYISTLIAEFIFPTLASNLGFKKILLLNISITVLAIPVLYLTNLLNLNYPIYILVALLGLAIGLASPYTSGFMMKKICDVYTIGTGFTNALWSIGYFTIPYTLSIIGSNYILDFLILIASEMASLTMLTIKFDNLKY